MPANSECSNREVALALCINESVTLSLYVVVEFSQSVMWRCVDILKNNLLGHTLSHKHSQRSLHFFKLTSFCKFTFGFITS